MWMHTGRPAAAAKITGEGKLGGTVSFYPVRKGILVRAQITGLPENDSGFYGFHIHQGLTCSGADYAGTGGHYNPNQVEHPRHAGDLPPLLSGKGSAYLACVTDRFSLREIVGRTVVIHSESDDFHTQPAGNAGRKIGCGVIHRIWY